MRRKEERILETERLILRLWRKEDATALFGYAQNPNVGPNAGWKPHADKKESQRIIESIFIPNGVWAIVLKESGKVSGSIGFESDKRRPGVKSREMGYSLAEDCWGKGLMTEAAKAVIEYGFKSMDLDVIAICSNPTNKRSQRVIEKCGFIYEGTERKAYRVYDGTIRDTKCYSILREEWLAGKDVE